MRVNNSTRMKSNSKAGVYFSPPDLRRGEELFLKEEEVGYKEASTKIIVEGTDKNVTRNTPLFNKTWKPRI